MTVYIKRIHQTPSIPEDIIGNDIFSWVVKSSSELLVDDFFSGPSCALYVATQDLGSTSSVQFWREALRDGFSFANPRDFPLTLSNALASLLAISLNIEGPNFTIVGNDNVHRDAYIQAIVDMNLKTVDRCIIVNMPSLLDGLIGKNIVISCLTSNEKAKSLALGTLDFCSKSNAGLAIDIEQAIFRLTGTITVGEHFLIETDVNKDISFESSYA
jgi:hypothetical protein